MQQFLQSQELQRHQLFYGRLDSQSTPPLPPAPQPTKKRSYFPSNPSSVDQTHEYASLQDKMGDAPNLQHHRPTTSSRLGLRSSGGEIVEVQGGHIVRSIGRKDRHSKVCTAKGPRDRRVRLSAHTAIQFYDVQDRLGYDRPSKAVDWLIKKAKTAIDELDEFPVWNPTSGSIGNSNMEQEDPATHHKQQEENTTHRPQQGQHLAVGDAIAGPSSKRPISMLGNEKSFQVQQLQNNSNNPVGSSSQSFLPPSLDSDAIDDTIKTFFPMGGSGESSSSAMQFQSFPNPELLSRTSSHSQDLRLSLQSFQDPMLLHHHNPQTQHHQNPTNQTGQSQSQAHAIFSGTAAMGFDLSGWSENQPSAADIGRFQRMAAWYASGDTTAALGGGGGAFMFNPPPLFGQSHLFSQRGPLQSSNTPSVRARMDTAAAAVTIAAASTDSYQLQQHHHQTIPIHQSSFAGIGFASGVGGFSCFQIPARIQGEEEEHDGISVKPSSASSDSRH